MVPPLPIFASRSPVPPLVSLTVRTTVPVPVERAAGNVRRPSQRAAGREIDGAAGDIDGAGQRAAGSDVGGARRLV